MLLKMERNETMTTMTREAVRLRDFLKDIFVDLQDARNMDDTEEIMHKVDDFLGRDDGMVEQWSKVPSSTCPRCGQQGDETSTKERSHWTNSITYTCKTCGCEFTWQKRNCPHGLPGWYRKIPVEVLGARE